MKKIKPVVLKDATKLTNSEMKKIRGGVTGESPIELSSVCSASCPDGYATSTVSQDCTDLGRYCDVVSGANFFGVGCYTSDGKTDHYSRIVYCEGGDIPPLSEF